MGTQDSNRISAQKIRDGVKLNQNEERDLNTARNQAGSEGRKLNRIVQGTDK